jgi:hypothetical protein
LLSHDSGIRVTVALNLKRLLVSSVIVTQYFHQYELTQSLGSLDTTPTRSLATQLLKIESESESESYVKTDGQSASLSWNEAPIWGLRQDIYYCLTITVLFFWGALFYERTGLSFVYATGPRQRSPSWVRGPLVSRPYFTVSDLRLPFSSPPTTHRVAVVVFCNVVFKITPLHGSMKNIVCIVA